MIIISICIHLTQSKVAFVYLMPACYTHEDQMHTFFYTQIIYVDYDKEQHKKYDHDCDGLHFKGKEESGGKWLQVKNVPCFLDPHIFLAKKQEKHKLPLYLYL